VHPQYASAAETARWKEQKCARALLQIAKIAGSSIPSPVIIAAFNAEEPAVFLKLVWPPTVNAKMEGQVLAPLIADMTLIALIAAAQDPVYVVTQDSTAMKYAMMAIY
jgi:hypothetical protein